MRLLAILFVLGAVVAASGCASDSQAGKGAGQGATLAARGEHGLPPTCK